MNNSSLLTADRATHLKIVVVGLIGATLVAGIGVASRFTDATMMGTGRFEATTPVVKAGKPITASTQDGVIIR